MLRVFAEEHMWREAGRGSGAAARPLPLLPCAGVPSEVRPPQQPPPGQVPGEEGVQGKEEGVQGQQVAVPVEHTIAHLTQS